MDPICIDCGSTIPGAAAQRRRCDTCRRARFRTYGKPIRQLRPDEVPPGEPTGRYVSSSGYVRLRWVTDTEYIEVYEHRFVMGAQPGQHVHHINGCTTDNDPANLEVLTPEEHLAEHGERRHRLDIAEAERLYATGLGCDRIGRRLGVHPVTVYRGLLKAGVTMRPQLKRAPA